MEETFTSFERAELLLRYLRAELNAGELSEFNAWLEKNPEQQLFLDQLMTEKGVAGSYDFLLEADQAAAWVMLQQRLGIGNEVAPVRRYPFAKVAAIAAAVTAMAVGVYFFNPFKHTGSEAQQTVQTLKNDVAPGKQGATLTLANGKQIRLGEAKDGELAKQAGVTVRKTADGQLVYTVAENTTNNTNEINTLSTTKGETYQVRLPDGTSVWLNAASSLTYSANLVERGKRRVRLDGEGYFEVAKDKSKPFVVNTGDQEVEVLGTQFNISGYSDEGNIATTLVEGSVSVSGSKSKLIIKPGEQATLTNGKLVAKEVDLEEVMDWKNGDFIFNQEPIESAMRKLARWYDIEVVYQGDIPNDGLQCAISKYRNLSQVLNVLEQTKIAKFKIEGRRVIVNRYTK